MPLPLEGIRVVDFSRVLAGPHCAKTLLDLGAEVIKLEPPGGDLSRKAFPGHGEISGYYSQQNAGKRNLSIDLNVPGARDVALRLCDTADVIVENFRPGALAAFGLDYQPVSARNPGVVYASISGYGQHGPFRSRMAYAPTIQAETGITATTADHFGRTGELRSDALSHADVYSGLHAAIAILACLTERERTGRGQYIDVAMAAVMLSVNERVHADLSDAELGAERPILGATDGPFFTGPRGERFASPMSLVGSMSFPFYLAAMRRPDLGRDPRFLTPELRLRNLEALHRIVQEWIWTFGDMESLDAQLDEAKIATGRVRSVREFAGSQWARDWHAVRTVSDRSGGEIKIPGRPWHFADQPAAGQDQPAAGQDQLAARQGEHNAEVLKELGYSAAQIEAFEASGALVQPSRDGAPSSSPDPALTPTPTLRSSALTCTPSLTSVLRETDDCFIYPGITGHRAAPTLVNAWWAMLGEMLEAMRQGQRLYAHGETSQVEAVQAEVQYQSAKKIAEQYISVHSSDGEGLLPCDASRSLDTPGAGIERLLVVVHGALRNSGQYFAHADAAAQGMRSSTLIVAPQFLADVDLEVQATTPAGTLYWGVEGWKGGERALGPAPISSFTAMDCLLQQLTAPERLPGGKKPAVVIIGNSAGGQYVNRYAAVGRGPDILAKRGIPVRFIVANPSTYLYFSEDRPVAVTNGTGINRWRYGFEAAPDYVDGTPQQSLKRYLDRDVTIVLGAEDRDSAALLLEVSAAAMAQGANRHERGINYHEHIQRLATRAGLAASHKVIQLDGVGHAADDVLAAQKTREIMFG